MKKTLFLIFGLYTIMLTPICWASDYVKCETNKDCPTDYFCVGGDKDCFFVRNICIPLEAGEIKTYKGKSYLKSLSPMGWWAAKNWCEANNRQLVDLKTLGLQVPNEYCSHTDCLSDTGKNLSPKDWQELRDSLGDDFFWVNDPQKNCSSFRVAPLLELLAYSGRPVNLRAFCE